MEAWICWYLTTPSKRPIIRWYPPKPRLIVTEGVMYGVNAAMRWAAAKVTSGCEARSRAGMLVLVLARR